MLTEEKILDVLKDVEDPELHRSLVDLNMIRNIKIDGQNVALEVVLTISGCPLKAKIEEDVIDAIKSLGAENVDLTFGTMTDEERANLAEELRGGKKDEPKKKSPLLEEDSPVQFIAVMSGKGGVGKSTVSVNLAASLARQGKKVGIIDADIYGFSVPDMMGIEQRPTVIDNVILPVERFGVKVISMGFFVEENAPVIWRGPMLGKMLRSFFNEVHWGELDYMILDLPPGTGDVALDIHQMIPKCKELVVSTPHATAAFVAARAGSMALKTNHEILGVVENMAYYQCGDCGRKDYIFGRRGGAKLAESLSTDLLAQIPLGQPETHPQDPDFAPALYPADSNIGTVYSTLAENILDKLNEPAMN